MIFSKDSKSPSASTVPNGAAESRAAHGGVPSIISADLKIVGDLKSNGDMQIDGTVEGDIDSRMLTIGEGASVKGAIAADTVRISGSIVGQVKANSVILSKTAKVSGDITHQTLTMEAGAVLEGGVRRMESNTGGAGAKVSPFRTSPNGSAGDAAYGAAAGKSM
jgi:cytoskeletal protein CcmA (bactofilin family)